MHGETAPGAASLGDYLQLLRRQWKAVLLCTMLGAAIAAAYLVVAPREYTARTSVLVNPTTGTAGSMARAADINLDTEAQLVTSTENVAAAAELMSLSADEADGLAGQVTVTVPPNTEILTIAFVGPGAVEAQQGAKAFAQAYLDGRRATAEAALDAEYDALQARIITVTDQLEQITAASADLPEGSSDRARAEVQIDSLNNQLVSLSSQQNEVRSEAVVPGRVVTQAALPTSPSSPDPLMTVATGLALGLLLGLGVAAWRHRADDCIRSAEDLTRRTDLRPLAALEQPVIDEAVSLAAPTSADGREYARLRNAVTAALEDGTGHVVLVAGVHGGGGPVAANLAASLARAGDDVVLLCADPFSATAGDLLPGGTPAGLADVLGGAQPVERALRTLPSLPTLSVLGPGRDPDRADALLQTHGPRQLVERLLGMATYIVIEAPATSDSAGAQTLAEVADVAMLVVEANRTKAREISDALMQFETMKRPALGAVLARSAPAPTSRPLPPPPAEAAPDSGGTATERTAVGAARRGLATR